jgi:hypothetical protein
MPKGNRRWTDLLLSLAFVLYALSAKAYRFVRLLMPLRSVSQLYQRLGPKIRFLKDRLTTLDGIASVCQAWRNRENIPPDDIIHVILACDAASFKPDQINGRQCSYCFGFMFVPLNQTFPLCLSPLQMGRQCHGK